MPSYKETTASGTAWKRCHRIVLENPSAGTQLARMFEEDIATIDGRTIKSESGMLVVAFNPEAWIMLRDPQTGELTGSYVTQAYLYEVLYSLYMQHALQRDIDATASPLVPE